MVTDERREQLLREYFSSQVSSEELAYTCDEPDSKQRLARKRLKMAVATVCHLLPEGGRVLDLGCGFGLAARTLGELGYEVTAVDLLPEMFASQQALDIPNIDWKAELFTRSVGQKHSFDLVLSLGFLEYQERAGKELVKMRQLLKPGGFLVLSVPNTVSRPFHFGIKRALFRLTSEPEKIPVRHSFTPERLQRLLGMAGLIFLDYQWLPQGEGQLALSKDRERELWTHRVKLRTAPEFLTLSRSYCDEDTATS